MGERKDDFRELKMEKSLVVWYDKSKVNSSLIGVMGQKGTAQ